MILLATSLATCSLLLTAFGSRSPDDEVHWRNSLTLATLDAQKTGKPMLVVFR